MKISFEIKNPFKRDAVITKQNIAENDPRFWSETYGGGKTKAGSTITEHNSLTSSTVFSCIDRLAQSVSVMPLALYRREGKEKVLADDHPVNWVLAHEPNPDMVPSTYKKTNMIHRATWGNSYAYIQRDNGGRVRRLIPLLPDSTTVHRDPATEKLIYTTTVNGKRFSFFGADILHIPGLSFDGLVGKSVIGLHRETIGLSVSAQEYGARFYGQGMNSGGVISMEGDLDDKQAAVYREQFESIYGGLDNSHRVAVIPGGGKFEKISFNNNDSQFLETRQFQKEEICGIFGVPPVLIQSMEKISSFGTGIEQVLTAFVRITLLPYLVAWEEAINQKLLTPAERKIYYAKFNVDGLQRGDFKTRMEGYNTGINNGMYSVNEARALEDMPPITGGDQHRVPLNTTDINSKPEETKK